MPSSNPNHSNPGKAGQQHNSTKQSVFNCFASCPRGLEEILVAELETMGAQKTRAVTGGCTFEASWRQATRMTYWTRFAGRIGLELARGECSSEDQFYNIAKSVDWYNWFKLSNTFRVDLNNLGADLQSVRFTQLRLKDAVCDSFLERFDERPNVSVEAPDVRIFAAITPTEAMVYIDLAGENLFKRGWREEAGVAPLKENLAAGLWHIARQSEAGKNANVFLDPFCGSGTLVIESLSQLCDRAPGLERPFAFENLKPFTPEWGRDLQEDANKRFNAGLDKAIKSPWFQWYASDITEVLISIAKENLAQAGFEELLDAGIVQFAQRDALTVEPPAETGIVFSNPPYGERVRAKGADVPEDEAYERLFKAYGDHLKMNFSGWTAFLFSGDLEIKKTLGLSPKRKRPLFNGPIECRLFEIPLTRGVYRPRAAGAENNAEAGSNPARDDDQAED